MDFLQPIRRAQKQTLHFSAPLKSCVKTQRRPVRSGFLRLADMKGLGGDWVQILLPPGLSCHNVNLLRQQRGGISPDIHATVMCCLSKKQSGSSETRYHRPRSPSSPAETEGGREQSSEQRGSSVGKHLLCCGSSSCCRMSDKKTLLQQHIAA